MSLGQSLAAELRREAISTGRMLERVPENFNRSPREKSMRLGQLSSHATDVPNWICTTFATDKLNLAQSGHQPRELTTAREFADYFDQGLSDALEVLQLTSNEDLLKNWRLRSGERIFFEMTRVQILRSMVLNHLIHHCGQFSIYLRLKDVPPPGVYDPSADEQTA